MTHARTLPRYVGAAGLVAGLLVAFPSLSHAQDYPPYYSQAERVHIASTYARQQSIASGTAVVPVNTRARWTSPDGSITRYRTSTINVPKSTLRIGALSSLSRGVMHPGFQVAILAAGFVLSQNNEVMVLSSSDPQNPNNIDIGDFDLAPPGYAWAAGLNYFTGYYDNPASACLSADLSHNWFEFVHNIVQESENIVRCYSGSAQYPSGSSSFLVTLSSYSGDYSYYDPGLSLAPASETDLENLDSYIPPQLYDELYNGGPIPQWQDAITVLGSPATGVSADGALAPELADAIGRWGENMDAQYNGDEAPHTDHPTTGNTAQDQVAQETLDGDIPDFPSVEPEWQVETIDELPSYNIGIGSGQCPPPTVITLPFPLNSTLTLNWQPFCDLAAMIRGAVIAVAMILSLYIVLRRG